MCLYKLYVMSCSYLLPPAQNMLRYFFIKGKICKVWWSILTDQTLSILTLTQIICYWKYTILWNQSKIQTTSSHAFTHLHGPCNLLLWVVLYRGRAVYVLYIIMIDVRRCPRPDFVCLPTARMYPCRRPGMHATIGNVRWQNDQLLKTNRTNNLAERTNNLGR